MSRVSFCAGYDDIVHCRCHSGAVATEQGRPGANKVYRLLARLSAVVGHRRFTASEVSNAPSSTPERHAESRSHTKTQGFELIDPELVSAKQL